MDAILVNYLKHSFPNRTGQRIPTERVKMMNCGKALSHFRRRYNGGHWEPVSCYEYRGICQKDLGKYIAGATWYCDSYQTSTEHLDHLLPMLLAIETISGITP